MNNDGLDVGELSINRVETTNFKIEKFFKDHYKNFEALIPINKDLNDNGDYVVIIGGRNFKVELKERGSEADKYNDILVECIQHTKALANRLNDVNFDRAYDINNCLNAKDLHMWIGWFYKSTSDWMLYVTPKYVYMIDSYNFKDLCLDLIKNGEVKLRLSTKGTCGLNYVIPVSAMACDTLIYKLDNVWYK